MAESFKISGRRDGATGRELPGTWLTERQGEALVYVVSCREPARPEDVGRDLAPEGCRMAVTTCMGRGYAILHELLSLGLLSRPHPGRYVPTEKGRIVAALHMVRRPGMAEAFFDED